MSRSLLLCFSVMLLSASLSGQISVNSTGNIGLGASAMPSYSSSSHRMYFLNSSLDRGFLFRTTKQSGGWMRGIINELHTTRHSAVMLAMINDIDKHSADRKSAYGLVNHMRHRGSGLSIGVSNNMYPEGTGEKRATYNYVSDNASENSGTTNHMFGMYNYVYATYRPVVYGSYTTLNNYNTDSNDRVYGYYVEDNGTGNAEVTGLYSSIADNNNSYAASFEGKVLLNGELLQSSDRILKDNIVELDSALSIISSLNPTSYNYNNHLAKAHDKGRQHYGFIAQEMEQVLPDLVVDVKRPARYKYNDKIVLELDSTQLPPEDYELLSPESTYKAIRYNDLIAILVQAVQEENDLIKDHAKRLKKQQGQLNDALEVLNPLVKSMATGGIADRRIEKLAGQLVEVRDSSAALTGQVAILQSHNSELTLAHQELRAEYTEVRHDYAALADEMAELRRMLRELRECTDCQGANGETLRLDAPPEEVVLYPNPADNRISIRYASARDYLIRLYSAGGQLIGEQHASDYVTRLNVADLPPGSYTVEISRGERIVKRLPLVIQ